MAEDNQTQQAGTGWPGSETPPSGTPIVPEKTPGATATVDEDTGIKIPADLSKVSDKKAKELIDAGLVQDSDLPAKMYKRKFDGFVARIPNYTFNAYHQEMKDSWDEITLTTEAPPADEAQA